jgi:hypothetical protein
VNDHLQDLMDALDARDRAAEEYERKAAEIKQRISDVVAAVSTIEDMGERTKVVLAVYERASGHKRKLARSVGMKDKTVRLPIQMGHGPRIKSGEF